MHKSWSNPEVYIKIDDFQHWKITVGNCIFSPDKIIEKGRVEIICLVKED